jgi:hypothetical protein
VKPTNKRTLCAALIAALLLIAPAPAYAAAWPIPITNVAWRNNVAWAGTNNTACVWRHSGSFGASFFAKTYAKVNFGGICNALWAPPVDTIRSRVKYFNTNGAIVLLGDSGFASNPAGATESLASLGWPWPGNVTNIEAWHQAKNTGVYTGNIWAWVLT